LCGEAARGVKDLGGAGVVADTPGFTIANECQSNGPGCARGSNEKPRDVHPQRKEARRPLGKFSARTLFKAELVPNRQKEVEALREGGASDGEERRRAGPNLVRSALKARVARDVGDDHIGQQRVEMGAPNDGITARRVTGHES
jgi:hypothetical protein